MKKATSILLALLAVAGLKAQTDYVEFVDGNLIYSQDFNAMESIEGSKDVPWASGTSPMVGWYAAKMMQDEYPQDVTVYSTGSETTTASSGLVSYGNDADRALGSRIANATGDMAYGVKIKNNTSAPIQSLEISYAGEQWTYANACPQVVTFAYKLNASIFDADYTEVQELTFTSPKYEEGVTTTNRIDGNLTENRAVVTHVINVNIPVGEYIFLRWSDINDPGSEECPGGVDHGLGIDDFSVTATLQAGIHDTSVGNISFRKGENEIVIGSDRIMSRIVIYDTLGKVVVEQSAGISGLTISTKGLTGGVYFARIIMADGNEAVTKFIR